MRMIENAAKVISETKTKKVSSTPYKASKKSDMKQIIWHEIIFYLRYPLTLSYNDSLKKKYIYTCIITTL